MTATAPHKKSLAPSAIQIGKRYRANRIDQDYDALVIGSGIGGLTTAACLSKQGKSLGARTALHRRRIHAQLRTKWL